jgi:splicing factor 3B subunit 3
MVLALAGGDIIYYELDQTGALSEVTQASLDAEVVAFDFSPVEKGRVRSSFLAVALSDFTTRIFELSADSCLRPLSTQNMRTAI